MEDFEDPRKKMMVSSIDGKSFDGAEPTHLIVTVIRGPRTAKVKFNREAASDSFHWTETETELDSISGMTLLMTAFAINELRDRGFDVGKTYSLSALAEANFDIDLDEVDL